MLNLVTNLAFIFLILMEVLLNRLLRSKKTDKQNEDKKSISLIWVTTIVAITTAFVISRTVSFSIYSHSILQYIGVVTIFIGIILRLFAIFTLGQFFTVDVTIRQNHKLKKDGLYNYLRHPSYFALWISFIGIGWTFNNWLSLLLIAIPILFALIRRMKIEEKLLIQHFGSEYTEYKKVTKGLIPFIY